MADAEIGIEWRGGEAFVATNDSGAEIPIDGARQDGLSPMQALLASLGACMAIDVVLILQKMREGLEGLCVSVEGERTDSPPRYYRSIHMRFDVSGEVDLERAERAVKLSLERYCSVFHTLRQDIEVTTSVLTK